MKKKDTVLERTICEYVYRILVHEIEEVESLRVKDHFVEYHRFSVDERSQTENMIAVECLCTMTLPDTVTKSLQTAFTFEILPAQIDSVRLIGTCYPVSLHSFFDDLWNKTVKYFLNKIEEKQVDPVEMLFGENSKMARSKLGAHSWPEDIWAHQQVHIYNFPRHKVRPEWETKVRNNPNRKLQIHNLDDRWKDIMKPEWIKGKIGKNN
jgi:hypothetical protein